MDADGLRRLLTILSAVIFWVQGYAPPLTTQQHRLPHFHAVSPPASLFFANKVLTSDSSSTTKQKQSTELLIPGESCTGEKLTVVGATGYIGKAVVKEAVRRGYPTTTVMRDVSKNKADKSFRGSKLREFDVMDRDACLSGNLFEKGSVNAVVCCLASRTGTKKDSFAIDYQASLNCAEAAKAAGARRFILLSAYCVKSAERGDPYALQFQYAKMELEKKLLEMSDDTFDYVSVRPTAFFKSLSNQVQVVDRGAPFVYFDIGEDKTAVCNPISEPDLANALLDQIADDSHVNTYWNLGGPDPGLSMIAQGEMIHDVLEKDTRLLGVPVLLFDVIINTLQWYGDTFNKEKFKDAAEIGRIVKYYAIEDMLTTDPSEKYGNTTLRQHYEYITANGEEYEPVEPSILRNVILQLLSPFIRRQRRAALETTS